MTKRQTTILKTIDKLENLQEEIINSAEWVFGDPKIDQIYIKALRQAIKLLTDSEVWSKDKIRG